MLLGIYIGGAIATLLVVLSIHFALMYYENMKMSGDDWYALLIGVAACFLWPFIIPYTINSFAKQQTANKVKTHDQ